MADRYDDERGMERERRSEYDRSGRDRYHERSATRRTTDEIRSWFGDEEARRRRERDGLRHQADLRREERFERGERGYEGGYEGERGGYDRGYGAPDPLREPSGRWDTGYGKDGEAYTDRTHGTDYPDGGYFDRSHAAEVNYGRAERYSSGNTPDRDRGGAIYSGRIDVGGGREDYRDGENSREFPEARYAREDEYRRSGSPRWNTETGPHTGRGPRGYQRSDDRIREDICDRLTRHGRIDATDVNIAVNSGEVTLSGMVDTREAKRLAEDIAESVHGVRDVTNQIKVYRGDYGRQPRGGEEGGIGERGAPQVLGLTGSREGTGTTIQSDPEANQRGSSTEPGRNKR
jgi:osmotically-inducible protein OsmY